MIQETEDEIKPSLSNTVHKVLVVYITLILDFECCYAPDEGWEAKTCWACKSTSAV
jgi:hypothetical protein